MSGVDVAVLPAVPQQLSLKDDSDMPSRLLVRPKAMKVQRPIPQRATEQFYEEAYRHGLPGSAVNAAIMESHDWHRKWTQQDEEGHTMPQATTTTSAVPAAYAYEAQLLVDRARNPSPEGGSAEPEARKRGRFDPAEEAAAVADPRGPTVHNNKGLSAGEQLPPLSQILWQNHQDQGLDSPSTLRAGSVDEEDDDHMVLLAPAAKRPVPVRPTAPMLIEDEDEEEFVFRPPQHLIQPKPIGNNNGLVRPVALRVPPLRLDDEPTVPAFIDAHGEGLLSSSNVSAITHSMASSLEDDFDFMPHTEVERNVVHVVENDEGSVVAMEQVQAVGAHQVIQARDDLLQGLAVSGGDATAEAFTKTVDPLSEVFDQREHDTRLASASDPLDETVQGTWLTLSKPTFFGNLGENDAGDPMYTLGRMTFDMFSPTGMICSLQGNFNSIEDVSDEDRATMLEAGLVPKSLREEVENKDVVLKTYNVITAFTIEPHMAAYPDAPNKDVRRPIKGVMTTYGYTLPDPETPNRHSIWITGGRIEPNNDATDIAEWNRLFALHPPKHGFGEKAKLLAVKLLMGATIPESLNEDGSMEYTFTRPLGGHGVAYVDVLYLDDTLRVVRGHRGTTFVFSRMQPEDQ